MIVLGCPALKEMFLRAVGSLKAYQIQDILLRVLHNTNEPICAYRHRAMVISPILLNCNANDASQRFHGIQVRNL